MDQQIPVLDSLEIQGTLELDHGPNKNRQLTISVTYLYILGGRLIIGCDEANPFEGLAQIILRGTHATPDWAVTEGPNVGSKVLGKYCSLKLKILFLYTVKGPIFMWVKFLLIPH